MLLTVVAIRLDRDTSIAISTLVAHSIASRNVAAPAIMTGSLMDGSKLLQKCEIFSVSVIVLETFSIRTASLSAYAFEVSPLICAHRWSCKRSIISESTKYLMKASLRTFQSASSNDP